MHAKCEERIGTQAVVCIGEERESRAAISAATTHCRVDARDRRSLARRRAAPPAEGPGEARRPRPAPRSPARGVLPAEARSFAHSGRRRPGALEQLVRVGRASCGDRSSPDTGGRSARLQVCTNTTRPVSSAGRTKRRRRSPSRASASRSFAFSLTSGSGAALASVRLEPPAAHDEAVEEDVGRAEISCAWALKKGFCSSSASIPSPSVGQQDAVPLGTKTGGRPPPGGPRRAPDRTARRRPPS